MMYLKFCSAFPKSHYCQMEKEKNLLSCTKSKLFATLFVGCLVGTFACKPVNGAKESSESSVPPRPKQVFEELKGLDFHLRFRELPDMQNSRWKNLPEQSHTVDAIVTYIARQGVDYYLNGLSIKSLNLRPDNLAQASIFRRVIDKIPISPFGVNYAFVAEGKGVEKGKTDATDFKVMVLAHYYKKSVDDFKAGSLFISVIKVQWKSPDSNNWVSKDVPEQEWKRINGISYDQFIMGLFER